MWLSTKRGWQAENSESKNNDWNFLGTAKEHWSQDGGSKGESERKRGKTVGQDGREVRQGHIGIKDFRFSSERKREILDDFELKVFDIRIWLTF